MKNPNVLVFWSLKISVAFAFIYPAISAVFNPFAWIGYFPPFIIDLAGNNMLFVLHTFGVTEILIALWILFGKKIFIPSVIAAAYLLGIILFNISQMDVIFRDVSILLVALALAISAYNKHQYTIQSSDAAC